MMRNIPRMIPGLLAATGLMITLAVPSASAQQKSTFMFDADPDAYWSGYWNWYDNEYVPGYRTPSRALLDAQSGIEARGYLGESPAISGAPDAGGNYDEHPAAFYVPNGVTEFYSRGVPEPDVVGSGEIVDPDLADSPLPSPAAAATPPGAVDPLEVTPTDRPVGDARVPPDTRSIPPDIDADIPGRAPAQAAKDEVWY